MTNQKQKEERTSFINYAIASVELEGFSVKGDKNFKALSEKYINGEIDSKQLKQFVKDIAVSMLSNKELIAQ